MQLVIVQAFHVHAHPLLNMRLMSSLYGYRFAVVVLGLSLLCSLIHYTRIVLGFVNSLKYILHTRCLGRWL